MILKLRWLRMLSRVLRSCLPNSLANILNNSIAQILKDLTTDIGRDLVNGISAVLFKIKRVTKGLSP